ncbi:carboxypeptidase-like regulatory domain-containing protein [Actinosynnema sp. NPDC002837]
MPLGERATPAVLPVVPDDWARPWPWDQLVRPYLARVVPRDGLMGHVPLSDIMLDGVTGTLAVDLKTVSTALDPPQARAAVVRVLDAVFGPVRELEQQRGSGSRPSVQALIGPRSVAEGSWCDPENITDEEREQAEAGQLVCMLTDDTEEVKIPERFVNALKGDLVISPGGTGLIGGMMRQVSLPQKYSHSGIMTRNYQEVTHSTASEERLLNNAGSDGFDPEVLKYLWPGVVTQGVGAAIHGEDFISPEGMPYSISSFEPHQVGASFDGNFEIVPPLVVKPDPEAEDVTVRQALRDVAEQARAAGVTAPETDQSSGLKQSKSHYRFYCYTNAEIGLTEIAPPEAGWAAGTFPTVCSSFIWLTHRKAKTRLEGPGPLVQQADLEPKDVETGAQVRHDTVDGLYEYTAAERLKAGQWLYDTIYNLAYDDGGWFGVLLTDGADDVANQLLNAFANDGAGGKDSELWRTTGDANAVSPDDLLWWDGPDTGGLYGHVEPVQYRAARTEVRRISRWQKVLSRGTVRGRVLLDGKAVAGAHVELPGGAAVADKTDADGAFEFADVPFGEYALTAWRVVKGVHHSAEVEVVHEAEDTELGDLVLDPPPEQFRMAQVHLDFWGSDHESAGDNETYSDGPRYHELDVSPDKPVNKLDEEYKWGGEMRVEYEVVVQLADDKAISVAVHGKLYEDTTESGDDLDHTGSHSIVVPEGEVRTFVHKMHNSDEDVVQDRGELTVKVVNAQNHA